MHRLTCSSAARPGGNDGGDTGTRVASFSLFVCGCGVQCDLEGVSARRARSIAGQKGEEAHPITRACIARFERSRKVGDSRAPAITERVAGLPREGGERGTRGLGFCLAAPTINPFPALCAHHPCPHTQSTTRVWVEAGRGGRRGRVFFAQAWIACGRPPAPRASSRASLPARHLAAAKPTTTAAATAPHTHRTQTYIAHTHTQTGKQARRRREARRPAAAAAPQRQAPAPAPRQPWRPFTAPSSAAPAPAAA